MNRKLHSVLGLMVAALSLCFDILTKWYMLEIVQLTARPPIAISSFFNLVAVWNPGVSFGMFAQLNQPLILSAVSLGITIILLGWLVKSDSRFLSAAIGLVIGGAIGNVIDRLRFGKVFDFIDIHAAGYHWPAFNIADSCIFIGVVLLLIHSIFLEKKNPTPEHDKETT